MNVNTLKKVHTGLVRCRTLSGFAILTCAIASAASYAESTVDTGFESSASEDPGYVIGNLNGQNGWTTSPDSDGIAAVQIDEASSGVQAVEVNDEGEIGSAELPVNNELSQPGISAQMDLMVPGEWDDDIFNAQNRYEAQMRLDLVPFGDDSAGIEFGVIRTSVRYNTLEPGQTAYYIEFTNANDQVVIGGYQPIDSSMVEDNWQTHRLEFDNVASTATLFVDGQEQVQVNIAIDIVDINSLNLENQRFGTSVANSSVLYFDNVTLDIVPSPVTVPASDADVTLSGFDNNDRFGHAIATIGDVNDDGVEDYTIGAYLRTVGGDPQTGRVYTFDGASDDMLWSGAGVAQGDQYGYSVNAIGDADGDGIPDVLVGARRNDAGGSNSGTVYLHCGSNGNEIWQFSGSSANEEVGISAAGINDVNGDGMPDIAVGAFGANNNTGRVYVLSGVDGAELYSIDGEDEGDRFGISVAGLADTNGDSIPEIGVGAYLADGSGKATTHSSDDGSLLDVFIGEAPGDQFGWSIADAGDVDDDGVNDIIIGARFNDGGSGDTNDDRGRAYVYSGDSDLLLYSLTGADAGANFGTVVAGVGDTDGDGAVDILVGAPGAGGGRLLSFVGCTGALIREITGESAGDQLGSAAAVLQDSNGDSLPEVLVGARFNDAVANNAGRVYQFLSAVEDDDDEIPGDLNGDGGVNGADLGQLLGAFGGPCDGCPEDLNGDDVVDGSDLGILLGNWGAF